MEKGYNGWTNRATWSVNLQLTQDYGTYHAMLDAGFTRVWREPEDVERFVKEHFPTGTPEMREPAELALVDWEQLAVAYNDGLEEPAD